MPEFYMTIARIIFFPNFWGHVTPPPRLLGHDLEGCSLEESMSALTAPSPQLRGSSSKTQGPL